MQIVVPEGIKNPTEHGEAVVHSGGIDQASSMRLQVKMTRMQED